MKIAFSTSNQNQILQSPAKRNNLVEKQHIMPKTDILEAMNIKAKQISFGKNEQIEGLIKNRIKRPGLTQDTDLLYRYKKIKGGNGVVRARIYADDSYDILESGSWTEHVSSRVRHHNPKGEITGYSEIKYLHDEPGERTYMTKNNKAVESFYNVIVRRLDKDEKIIEEYSLQINDLVKQGE